MLTIAAYTLHEAARKRLLVAVVVLTVLFLAFFGIGSHFLAEEIRRHTPAASPSLPMAAGLMTTMAFSIVAFLGGLLAIFVAIGSISSEVETGTILGLAARPIRRWEIVVGKWVGLAALVILYLVVVSAGLLVISQYTMEYAPPEPRRALVLLVLEALVLLSVAILGSTIFSTLTNGVLTFMLYGVGWVGGLVEGVGSIFNSQPMINAGIVSSLIVPTDALWRGASFHLQPVALILAQNMSPGLNPFTAATPITPPMLWYSLAYLAACLLLAVRGFEAKDL